MENDNLRGYKVTVAVLAIVQGALLILVGILLIAMRAISNNVFDEFRDSGDMMFPSSFFYSVLTFMGVMLLALGIVYIILGIKFTSHKQDKGIAITLLVFCFLGLNVITIIMIVFLFIYLSKLGNPQGVVHNNQFTGQPNVGSFVNQPITQRVYCAGCGAKAESGDTYCKMCGKHL